MTTHPSESRLEVQTGDANMSPWATTLKFAATSLVLRLLEQERTPGLAFKEPLEVLKNVADAARLHSAYELKDGGTTTAIAHQQAFAEAALTLSEEVELPAEEVELAQAWYEVCDDLKQANVAEADVVRVADRVDWAAKLRLITRMINSPLIHRENIDAVTADLLWERLGDGYGARYWRRMAPLTGFDPTSLSAQLRKVPPTNARVRQRIIELKNPTAVDVSEWHKAALSQVKGVKVIPVDPYQTTMPLQLQEAIDGLQKTA